MIDPRVTKWISLIAPAIIAMALQLIATSRFGAGLAPDSAVYINTAQRIAAGEGVTQRWANTNSGGGSRVVPMTWYPPAYPALLSIAPRIGVAPATFARYSSALLLGLTVFIASVTAWRATNESLVATPVLGAILCFSADQLEVFSYALSEPLFVPAAFGAMLLIARHCERPHVAILLCAAGCAALAGMTRYIGVILAPVGAILILALSRRALSRRFLDALIFAILAGGANVFWFLRNARVGGTSTGRAIEWHPINASHARELCETVTQWIVSWPALAERAWWIALPVIIFGTVLVTRAIRRDFDRVAMVLSAFVVTYLAALALSISFVDAATPVDYRLLSPLFVPIVLLGAHAWRARTSERGRIGLLIFAGVVILGSAIRTPIWVSRAKDSGERLAYASPRWERSRAIRAMQRVPEQTRIWTNAPDVTFLHASRIDALLPRKTSRDGSQQLDDFDESIASIRETILKDGGAIVYLRMFRRGMPNVEDLDRLLNVPGMRRVEFPGDAVVWAHPSAARRFTRFAPTTRRAPSNSKEVEPPMNADER